MRLAFVLAEGRVGAGLEELHGDIRRWDVVDRRVEGLEDANWAMGVDDDVAPDARVDGAIDVLDRWGAWVVGDGLLWARVQVGPRPPLLAAECPTA